MPPLVSQLASFSTFAVGFIARPIGGIVFGHFGDRVGRKRALVTALLMMGIATTLIGCLPSYALAGALAPLLLIVLRFVQGLAIGGQWAGAVLLATESAPPGQRGFYGSLAQTGAPIGTILANLAFLLVSTSLTDQAFLAWGWRVPFLVSVVLIALGLYVQLRLEDTAAFRELRALKERRDAEAAAERARQSRIGIEAARAELAAERQPSPVLEAVRTYPKQIALAAGSFIAAQVTFYILVAFVIAYGSGASGLGIPRSTMLVGVLIGAVVMIPGVIVAAVVSDRHGRRGVIMLAAAALALWGFALFPLIDTRSLLWISVGMEWGKCSSGRCTGRRRPSSPRSRDPRTLLGRVARIPARRHPRRRARPDHRDCASRQVRQHDRDFGLHRAGLHGLLRLGLAAQGNLPQHDVRGRRGRPTRTRTRWMGWPSGCCRASISRRPASRTWADRAAESTRMTSSSPRTLAVTRARPAAAQATTYAFGELACRLGLFRETGEPRQEQLGERFEGPGHCQIGPDKCGFLIAIPGPIRHSLIRPGQAGPRSSTVKH